MMYFYPVFYRFTCSTISRKAPDKAVNPPFSCPFNTPTLGASFLLTRRAMIALDKKAISMKNAIVVVIICMVLIFLMNLGANVH
jgi:hypothetical protein